MIDLSRFPYPAFALICIIKIFTKLIFAKSILAKLFFADERILFETLISKRDKIVKTYTTRKKFSVKNILP